MFEGLRRGQEDEFSGVATESQPVNLETPSPKTALNRFDLEQPVLEQIEDRVGEINRLLGDAKIDVTFYPAEPAKGKLLVVPVMKLDPQSADKKVPDLLEVSPADFLKEIDRHLGKKAQPTGDTATYQALLMLKDRYLDLYTALNPEDIDEAQRLQQKVKAEFTDEDAAMSAPVKVPGAIPDVIKGYAAVTVNVLGPILPKRDQKNEPPASNDSLAA